MKINNAHHAALMGEADPEDTITYTRAYDATTKTYSITLAVNGLVKARITNIEQLHEQEI